MNSPIPAGSGKISQQLRDLRNQSRRATVIRTPNALISIGPMGTLVQPTAEASNTSTKKVVAVWA